MTKDKDDEMPEEKRVLKNDKKSEAAKAGEEHYDIDGAVDPDDAEEQSEVIIAEYMIMPEGEDEDEAMAEADPEGMGEKKRATQTRRAAKPAKATVKRSHSKAKAKRGATMAHSRSRQKSRK